MSKGKLIVLEGLDGSGKATQAKLLAAYLKEQGFSVREITFPNYASDSSALVRMYLAGQFGARPDDVNAYAASSFYAVDRYANYKLDWEQNYRRGEWILASRYTTSNAIHQMSKLPEEQWDSYLEWLADYEYDKLGLPRPNLVIYLDVPTDFTEKMLRHRETETHTHADIHEQDMQYLATCRRMGRAAAEHYGWTVIRCVRDGAMRSMEDIHEEIYRHVAACLED